VLLEAIACTKDKGSVPAPAAPPDYRDAFAGSYHSMATEQYVHQSYPGPAYTGITNTDTCSITFIKDAAISNGMKMQYKNPFTGSIFYMSGKIQVDSDGIITGVDLHGSTDPDTIGAFYGDSLRLDYYTKSSSFHDSNRKMTIRGKR
jgi:hypothetical protein